MKFADMILCPIDHKIGAWLYRTFKLDISYAYRHGRAYDRKQLAIRKLAKKGII